MRRRHGIALVAGAVALTTGLGTAHAHTDPARRGAPTAPSATAAAEAACGLTDKLVPTCDRQALFGAWAKGYTTGPLANRVADAEDRYDRKVDVVHTYHAPSNNPIPFADDAVGAAERRYAMEGRVVLANFKPAPNFTAAASEAYEPTIRQAAANIGSVAPHKVMVTLHHEPEDEVSGGANCPSFKGTDPGNTTAAYRAMWRRTRDIFDAVGVTNVVWVMNYMGFQRWDCMVDELWPGRNLVDWIAYDPYSINGTVNTITRFPAVLRQPENEALFAGLPLMLAEFGVDDKSQSHPDPAKRFCRPDVARRYYENLRNVVDTGQVRDLRAFVVFDSNPDNEPDYRVGRDCTGQPDQAEQEAFNRFASHPHLFPTITN